MPGRAGTWLALDRPVTTMTTVRRAPLLALLLTVLSTTRAAAQSPELDSFVLFALEGIRTKGLSLTSGNIGVNDPNGAVSATIHGVIDAPQSDIMAGMVRASTRSTCRHLYANIVPDTLPGCQPPAGFTTLALPIMSDPLAACQYPSPFPDDCTTAPPVLVDRDTERTLAPGSYGDVVMLSSAAQPGRLILTGGDYSFCSLRAGGRSARILFQGPSTVKILNEVNLGASGYLGGDPGFSPLVTAGADPPLVLGSAERVLTEAERESA